MPITALVLPAAASWPYVLGSELLHFGYSLFLVRTYRTGDLGQTYPIARGSSPVLVTLGAALFAGEIPTPLSVLGVILVSAGMRCRSGLWVRCWRCARRAWCSRR